MEKTINLKKLELNEEEADGISFFISENKSNKIEWNFTVMQLNSKQEDVTKTNLGYIYQIVFYHNEKEAEIFEAILGDLEYYVKNLVNSNQEGLILKKCKKSEEILSRIFKKRLVSLIANNLKQIAEKKQTGIL